MHKHCVLCGEDWSPDSDHICSDIGLRNMAAKMEVEDRRKILEQKNTAMRVHKRMEDHPVYAEMILRSFFELAEHAMNMSAEQLEKAWEARVRLTRFAFSKAFPND